MAMSPYESAFCKAVVEACGMPWKKLKRFELIMHSDDAVRVKTESFLEEPDEATTERIKKFELTFEEKIDDGTEREIETNQA